MSNLKSLDFYLTRKTDAHPLHLRLEQWQQSMPLSDILPLLENFGLRTDTEEQRRIPTAKNARVWVSDFAFLPRAGMTPAVFEKAKPLLEEAFTKVYVKEAENDRLNQLVLSAFLSWRDVIILRAYLKYLRQIAHFSSGYIENILVKNHKIVKLLVSFFKFKHQKGSKAQCEKTAKRVLTALEAVTSLEEDRILRRFLVLMQATVRTNFFQHKPYCSFKFSSRDIPGMPQPVPLYEIFVYSTQIDGIHLRYDKIARGGIRWSDRPEDFRTEILGLMKAQKVKNSVIVPSGAKGGFVLKQAGLPAIEGYKQLMCGLLDLTDNIKGKRVIHPKDIICYDGDDPYLVVAADKGTATFSDTANELSLSYGFWLGDAFASGGKTGYDHKKMGITAKGAWESIRRHFLETAIDIHRAEITVVGIGDMSGDVFGNGLLYSKHVKLLAAFDHRHIFIDPTPNPLVSYQERARLFRLKASSWADYNAKKISSGGGVFPRNVKSITLSTAMQKCFGTTATALTPNELIRVILKAPVDLLFNGGIGTYVKASFESHAEVSDRTNDTCRINGNELRCKVVGEGGNLGFTQLGRVEYALQGGLINTDFIDNSAGVDCSDHEVNLKILLDHAVEQHKLSYNKRNQLLKQLTADVAEHVLRDNYSQALVMSFSAPLAKENIGLHIDYIKELELHGGLDRHVEYLPDDKVLLDRKANGLGLTRPELAVLLSYSKIHIKQVLVNDELMHDAYFEKWIENAFPERLQKKYQSLMRHHKLRHEIIATQLSNMIVNQAGLTFVYRLQTETSASIPDIVRAYVIAANVFEIPALQRKIELLDGKISCEGQYQILFHIRRLLHIATRWFLRSRYLKQPIPTLLNQFGPAIKKLEQLVPHLMTGETKAYLHDLQAKCMKLGLSAAFAQHLAAYRALYNALNIIDIVLIHHFDLVKVTTIYFAVGEKFSLVWLRDYIASDLRSGHWNAMARLTLRDELDTCQRNVTIAAMTHAHTTKDPIAILDHWISAHPLVMSRWEKLLNMLHASPQIEYTMLFIALRELLGFVLV